MIVIRNILLNILYETQKNQLVKHMLYYSKEPSCYTYAVCKTNKQNKTYVVVLKPTILLIILVMLNRTIMLNIWCDTQKNHHVKHMMRNARFGPLTLLMTLRVIDVKRDYKFTRLFYVSIHDAYIRFYAEAVFIGTDISFRLS